MWDAIADVVVVGTGVAGFAAAVTAASEGADVLLLEKAQAIGGTTVKSSATMWIPNNPVMRRLGLEDPRADALRYMAKVGFPTIYDPDSPTLGLPPHHHRMLETFYDRGSEAYEYLDRLGVIDVDETQATRYPDYHADLPEDLAPVGRSLRIAVPEGWRFGHDTTGGQMLIDRMAGYAAQHGARVRLGCRASQLVQDTDGAVVGVMAEQPPGSALIGARRAVIFASGGFLHNPELRREFLRGPVFGGAASETSTGDFIAIATAAGARLGNMTHAWWDQVVLELAIDAPTTRDVVSPFGDSMLMVNRHGMRVLNEKMPYSERGPVHFNWDVGRREYPNLLLFMIYDEQVAQDPSTSRFRWPIPPPGDSASYVVSGPDWDGLTHAIAERLEELRRHTGGLTLADEFTANLRRTVDRFGEFARSGKDLAFHRGETPIEQAWNRQGQTEPSSTTMRPFADAGPFHCVILGAGALDTKGGPVTDADAHVLGDHDQPIPGLYGAGNCVASPVGQAYFGPGGTVGPGLTFGYIAARNAVAEPSRWPRGELELNGPLRPVRV